MGPSVDFLAAPKSGIRSTFRRKTTLLGQPSAGTYWEISHIVTFEK